MLYTSKCSRRTFSLNCALLKLILSKSNHPLPPLNLSFDENKFDALHQKVLNYLSEKELYVRDAYACADEKYRMNIRVVNEYAWSNMFAYNMFLRPTDEEVANFQLWDANDYDHRLKPQKLMNIIELSERKIFQ